MRPPHRSRASRIVTLLPARASSRAVMRPVAPAPTIRKCVGCRGPSITVLLLWPDSASSLGRLILRSGGDVEHAVPWRNDGAGLCFGKALCRGGGSAGQQGRREGELSECCHGFFPRLIGVLTGGVCSGPDAT